MKKKNRFVILAIFFSSLTMMFASCNKTSDSKKSSNNNYNSEVSSLTPSNGEDNMKIKLMIENKDVTVNFEDNCATKALKDKLKLSPVKITMNDYGGFEKVGGLGFDLPTCNEQINTEPGDIVLYQGNQLVIFYGTNNWDYTRIGKIMGLNTSELKNILGQGSLTVTLSLENN